ncbi:polysaccharide deacetylase 2 family uncharacterized protein YibQ [Azospirillum fermentarium]|uniref:divergent polysaccharide deacetylase family protein n=1 Tax=Azospirillum fermentarium TaxID=1233114 RepID=UPI002225DBC5|nr:divergent polysaccharide deacetylase family protein [Azospirillum fermentarium]MCW2247620.1 polysaccharide deacetylase 2 family uncharacterized protein YibQ [Azospirillum fermentarium]
MAPSRKTPAKKTGTRSRKRKSATLPGAIGRAFAAAQRLGSHPVGLALSVLVALAATVITANHFLSRPMTPPAPAVQTPVAQVAVKPPPLPPPPPPAAEAVPEPADPPPLGVTEPEPGTNPDAAPPAPAAAIPPQPEKPVETALLPPPQPPRGGTPAWQRNAVPSRVLPDRPAIAIVIDDMGLDRKRSARVVGLPAPLTLAWLPYAHDLPAQTKTARAAGHELMVHLPMEPSVKADPGPNALLSSLPAEEIRRRLTAALASFDGYVGVNNHMGSRFTADRSLMAPVLAEIQKRGLLWLDSRTTPNSAAGGLAGPLHLPFAGRDVFLDNVETVTAVRTQLSRTEAVARHQGVAIAIGHPHDATIDALAAWLPEVQKRGFTLVTISAVVRARGVGG